MHPALRGRLRTHKFFFQKEQRQSDAKPTGSDPGLHYVEYVHVSRACPSV